jgi:hypothetical protein
MGIPMIIGEPAPFVSALIEAIDEIAQFIAVCSA